MRLRFLGRIAAIALLGSTLGPSAALAQPAPTTRPTQQELTSVRAGDKDWITYGGSVFNERWSTLDQITTGNVATLKGAFGLVM